MMITLYRNNSDSKVVDKELQQVLQGKSEEK